MSEARVFRHADGICRCHWCGTDPLYMDYHDTEWGVPERDSRALFEKLLLDGFQAGLSWITILRKRDNFREAFDGFDPEVIARWRPARVEKLMQNPGIVRNRAKITASITNARAYLEIDDFSAHLWSFTGGKTVQNRVKPGDPIAVTNDAAKAMSKDLMKRGFKFVGPTIIYAFMQATGMVNDHVAGCHRAKLK